MIEGHGALVGVEDLPLVELYLSLAIGFLEKRVRKRLGQGAAGDGNTENLVALERSVLGVENVGGRLGASSAAL